MTSRSPAAAPSYYYYFAIGSNMVPSTMTCLRNLSPNHATAAILPDYRLAFDIGGGGTGAAGGGDGGRAGNIIILEPSAASVRYCGPGQNNVVHGVLYELSKADFRSLTISEGVPIVYRWQDCRVIPYRGDGATAGEDALQKWRQQQRDGSKASIAQSQTSSSYSSSRLRNNDHDDTSVPAVVLMKSEIAAAVAGRMFGPFPFSPIATSSGAKNNNNNRSKSWYGAGANNDPANDIPPSQSYLGLLQRGARLWRLDSSYQEQLSDTETAPSVTGISGIVLAVAELCNPRPDLDLLL